MSRVEDISPRNLLPLVSFLPFSCYPLSIFLPRSLVRVYPAGISSRNFNRLSYRYIRRRVELFAERFERRDHLKHDLVYTTSCIYIYHRYPNTLREILVRIATRSTRQRLDLVIIIAIIVRRCARETTFRTLRGYRMMDKLDERGW